MTSGLYYGFSSFIFVKLWVDSIFGEIRTSFALCNYNFLFIITTETEIIFSAFYLGKALPWLIIFIGKGFLTVEDKNLVEFVLFSVETSCSKLVAEAKECLYFMLWEQYRFFPIFKRFGLNTISGEFW